MRSKRDLFRGQTNPNFYEAVTSEDAAILKTVLDESNIEYEEVPHQRNGSWSYRFFVDTKQEDFVKSKINQYKGCEKSTQEKEQFEYEKSLYFRQLKK